MPSSFVSFENDHTVVISASIAFFGQWSRRKQNPVEHRGELITFGITSSSNVANEMNHPVCGISESR